MKHILLVGLLCFFLILFVVFLYDRFRKTAEGFNEINGEYIYYPKKVDKNDKVSTTFLINDFMKDAIEVPECIKVYKKLMPVVDPSNSMPVNEYFTKDISTTDIYKKYKTDMTEDAKAKAIMDDKYGFMFMKETFILPNKKKETIDLNLDFKPMVEKALLFENKLHNFIKYSTIKSFDAPFSFTEFSDYFATIIFRYYDKPAQLEQIKTFMYKLLTPIYLYSKFVDHFVATQSAYTQKDDILYVLNTAKELLKNVKIDEFLHSATDKNVYIFKADTANASDQTMTVDSLTLFSMTHILLQVRKITQPNGSKYTPIPDEEFASVFQAYLEKKYAPIEPEKTDKPDKTPKDAKTATPQSVIVFALRPENAPSLVDG